MSSVSSESTLPTLRDAIDDQTSAPRLRCTIIFHPQIERIGQSTVLDASREESVLGRHGPVFSDAVTGLGEPLADPYISRRAIVFQPVAGGLRLIRPEKSSRCRVAGKEVQGEMLLDDDALDAGVPVLLSHSVVLMLRHSVLTSDESATPEFGLIGTSPAVQLLREQIRRAANSELDVLVRGETGSGKELVAQAIHAASRRAANSLVSVNVAAIPGSLAAAFLFGSTRGAFTGADKARPGYFQQAEGGTLFLDEIGDAPEEIQPLLLRALQQREIQVVGGATRKIDVRVVSATDALLESEDCNFKSALRYRLGALEISVPALRDHPEDIGEILLHSLRRVALREGRERWLEESMADDRYLARWTQLFHRFACFHWPGNVRQLENFAAQVVLASGSAPEMPAAVSTELRSGAATIERAATDQAALQQRSGKRKLADISEAEFEAAMHEAHYEVAAVAAALGVSRQSLYRRIETSRLFRSASDVPVAEIEAALDNCDQDVREAAIALQVSESGLRQRLRALRASA